MVHFFANKNLLHKYLITFLPENLISTPLSIILIIIGTYAFLQYFYMLIILCNIKKVQKIMKNILMHSNQIDIY